MFPRPDSFHPLPAEVTHNETADPSLTFHFPEHEVPNSPADRPASGQCSVSTAAEESETHTDHTVDSELSPERLRTQEQSSCSTALHESFSHIVTSQCLPHDSVLTMSPTTRPDVDLTALSLLHLTMCDATPDLAVPLPEEAETDETCISEKRRSAPSRDLSAEELKSEQGSNLRNSVSKKILVPLLFHLCDLYFTLNVVFLFNNFCAVSLTELCTCAIILDTRKWPMRRGSWSNQR